MRYKAGDLRNPNKHMVYVDLKVEGKERFIEEGRFKDLIFDPICPIKKDSDLHWEEFHHFVHYVSLEDVPMYLNKFPELATWRLREGK